MGIDCSCFQSDLSVGSVMLLDKITVVPLSHSLEQIIPDTNSLKSLCRGYLVRTSVKRSLNPRNVFEISNLDISSYESSAITTTEKTLPAWEINVSGPVYLIGQEYYQGSFNRRFMRHGQGVLILPDNSKYIGEFKLGKMHGKGRMIFENGDVYEGNFRDNKAQGFGTYIQLNGYTYKGGFKNDKQHGFGIETWNNGSKYEGFYKKGLKHGKGQLLFPNNVSYTGDFFENRIEGDGVYRWSEEKWYEGEMVDNKMQGRGELHSHSGVVYIGEFFDDLKNGYGKCEWPDGRIYEGYWKNGVQHGEGCFNFMQSGKFVKKHGVWTMGKREMWLEG